MDGVTQRDAKVVLRSLGTSGQPPKRGARLINVGTEPLLGRLRDEYLRDHCAPFEGMDGGGACKWVEADYGKTVQKMEGNVSVDGEAIQVSLFRLGRLALLYRTPDGSRVGFLNRDTGKWEELPRELADDISSATDLAERKRGAEMVTLPVGRLLNR